MTTDLVRSPQPKISERSRVVKSNALARSAYNASIEAQRILAYSFAVLADRSPVQTQDDEDLVVTVPVKELAQIFSSMGKSKTLYERVRSKRKELTGFSIDLENEQEKKWQTWVLVTNAEYDNGVLTLTFNKKMREHIGELKRNFLAYQLMFICELDSPHDQHLYEILRSYLHEGMWTTAYEDLLKRLNLTKVKRYALVGNFKKDILAPFVARANAKTDMAVSVEDMKVGRRIVGFTFYMSEKHKPIESFSDSQKRVLALLTSHGVSSVIAQKLVLSYDVPYIEEKIAAAIAHKKAGRIKKSVAGWIVSAIRDGYDQLTDEERANLERRRRIESVVSVYERCDEELRLQILDQFLVTLGDGAERTFYDNEGLGHPLVRKIFAGYLRTKGATFGLEIPTVQ